MRRLSNPEVETGIVDQNQQVVAAHPDIFPQRSKQPIVRLDLGQDLDYPEGGQPLHGIANDGTRLLHLGSAEGFDGGTGIPLQQRAHQTRAMEITRRLGGGDENARLAPRGHQWGEAASDWVRTASATRRASASAARPSSPRTTTSRSPRTACTKLCSSSARASASGASRTMRSTTSASSRPVPGCHSSRTRMNSPPPLAKSREKYPFGWNRRRRRIRSRATLDAVACATAPLANSTRALARSRWGESTEMPEARTSVAALPPVRGRTGSRSWIMRPTPTATSFPRD